MYSQVPADFLPLLEEAATEVADEVTRPRPEGQEELGDTIQVVLQVHKNESFSEQCSEHVGLDVLKLELRL